MELKRFFKSQIELSDYINKNIDSYWTNTVSESELIVNIKAAVEHNMEKVFSENGEYTAVVRQRSGKRRLEVVSKIVKKKVEI